MTNLLARGFTDKDVAKELALGRYTAHGYTERVLTKLGVHSRGAVTWKLLERQDE